MLFTSQLVNGKEELVGVKGELLTRDVGEVPGVVAVADDKQLHEEQQRVGVAAARFIAVLDDLLHGSARGDAQRLQLDLHSRQAVDEQNYIVAMVAVIGVDTQLVDDLEVVFAPVL